MRGRGGAQAQVCNTSSWFLKHNLCEQSKQSRYIDRARTKTHFKLKTKITTFCGTTIKCVPPLRDSMFSSRECLCFPCLTRCLLLRERQKTEKGACGAHRGITRVCIWKFVLLSLKQPKSARHEVVHFSTWKILVNSRTLKLNKCYAPWCRSSWL